MSSSSDTRLAALFERALNTPREQREEFLAAACRDDATLRQDLASLLEAHESAGDYFEDLFDRLVAPALIGMSAPPEAAGSALLEAVQTKLDGTYRLDRELGGGGMSSVFLAEDLTLKRLVVLKVLSPAMVRTAHAGRFQREIELAARLQHPHIVPVLSADTADGTSYYTMPYVKGESLRDRLAREGPLPVDDALRIWRDVLDALSYAHAAGVIHRDIKPGNVLLSGRNALVTDFGVARAIETAAGDGRATTPGLAIGTPAYMAPEQAAGDPHADHRVDIYQAGLVMYEMLAGRLPFDPGSAHELLRARVTREPLPLDRSEAPSGLVALVMRCLARNPSARPQSAEAALIDLDQVGVDDGRPPRAGASPRRPRLRRIASYAAACLALPVAVLAIGSEFRSADGAEGTVDIADETVSRGQSAVSGTSNVAAHEWYRRGTDVALLRTDAGLRQAVGYLQNAIAIDSTYADAFAALAVTYLSIRSSAPSREEPQWFSLAEQAALKAVAIDDSNPEALAARGRVRAVSGEYRAAEADYKRAISLNPLVFRGHEGLARVYMWMGRAADQLSEARLGVEADPYSHSAIRELALALAMNGRCEESLDQLAELKTLTPPTPVAGILRGLCYASEAMWPQAIAELEWAGDHGGASALGFLGHALARAGREEEATAILDDMLSGRKDSHGAFGIAAVYAGMRDYDQAFAWLDKAVAQRQLTFYVVHPIFADLHRDPRFEHVRAHLAEASP